MNSHRTYVVRHAVSFLKLNTSVSKPSLTFVSGFGTYV